MRIVCAGDWHGNRHFAVSVIGKAVNLDADCVVQLGDFGFWPGPSGAEYLNRLEAALAPLDFPLYVIKGNHDDPHRYEHLTPTDEGFGWVSDHISFIPNGHRWEWDGAEFGALGGAASIDREWRVGAVEEVRRKKDPSQPDVWWPEEEPTLAEAMQTMGIVRKMGGDYAQSLDVLLTHEGPNWTAAGYEMGHPGMQIPFYDRLRSHQIRAMIDFVAESTEPKIHLHGHHHARGTGRSPWGGLVIGLDADDRIGPGRTVNNNIYLVDTQNLPEVEEET